MSDETKPAAPAAKPTNKDKRAKLTGREALAEAIRLIVYNVTLPADVDAQVQQLLKQSEK
jgi:hypothetical protein